SVSTIISCLRHSFPVLATPDCKGSTCINFPVNSIKIVLTTKIRPKHQATSFSLTTLLNLYKTYTMRLYYCTLLSLLILSISLYAQEDITYQQPSEPILSLANYEPAPAVSMDTKKNYMLLSYRSAYKSLADLNNEEMRLGGLRIN